MKGRMGLASRRARRIKSTRFNRKRPSLQLGNCQRLASWLIDVLSFEFARLSFDTRRYLEKVGLAIYHASGRPTDTTRGLCSSGRSGAGLWAEGLDPRADRGHAVPVV